MTDDLSLRVYAADIEQTLKIEPTDLRCLRRVTRADLDARAGRRTPNGRLPQNFALTRVIEWLGTIADLLTPATELTLRKSAFELTN